MHNLATLSLVVRNPATLVLRWHMCRPLALCQPVRGVVAGIQLNHTHWVLVAPRVPEKAYRALWLCSLSKLLCWTYSLRPLPTGLWPMVLLRLINGLIVVNLMVKWSIVVPNC